MQFIKLNLSIIFSLILFSSFSSNASFAQENSSNSFVGLEEIIVTAQKREQNINEVGMSIDVNGMISWTPVDTQAGYNQVYVLVSDPSGDIDSIHYNIFVTDSIIGIANIEFNKVLFLSKR